MAEINRIELISKENDTRAKILKEKLSISGFNVTNLFFVDVYTLEKDFSKEQLLKISKILQNPITQEYYLNEPAVKDNFNWAIEIGYLPGVTDNVSTTFKQEIEDLFNINFLQEEGVYTSKLFLISGNLKQKDIDEISYSLYNPLIQRASIKSLEQYVRENGMEKVVPKVKLKESKVDEINLNVSDEELIIIGKKGIKNQDGTRRGPLALDLDYMKAIKDYFNKLNRNPTDIELESIAQTWSEHCKHTIFAAEIDNIKEGLYKEYIKDATNQIRKNKGKKDFCVSVFKDNSGAIVFDKNYLITDKVETHNSPSALDPFGGSITGIVGVNRDAIGFGLGAKPIINRYGFCFANPKDYSPLYKGKNKTEKMLSPKRIMEGVIDGVNVGGNCSGIPTPSGFVYFDKSYKGKPLVFVGTLGLIPRKTAGRNSYEKSARAGDFIVMVGGRVGLDGIHGATFSSETMDSGSPATAVQIGDPITQKKLSDAIVKEARDLKLYNSITDNGAGGLSCSVAEMAQECGGCIVELDKIPLKYPGLDPWQIWISESQERMTLSVPKENISDFLNLMKRRGVEATVIGEFNSSNKCIANYKDKTIMDIDMEFLHNGLPKRKLSSVYNKKKYNEPFLEEIDLNKTFLEILKRPNICSYEFISKQYDHEVQGGSVIKPLQGKGRVNGEFSVTRPLLSSNKAVIISQALYPTYSLIDTYDMAACSIDTAIRNIISGGGKLENIALLDNFCWCESDTPQKLGELVEACRACKEIAIAYETPFISGKDSMFNSFKGYDENNNPVLISVLPTLLISSLAVMDDSRKSVSIDLKLKDDLIYVIGETFDELGGSEFFDYLSEVGNVVPKVDVIKNKKNYNCLSKAIDEELISSSISVNRGGLSIALAKMAIAGNLGVDVSFDNLKGDFTTDYSSMFSESQGRIVVTINPKNQKRFEETMTDCEISLIGKVISKKFIIRSKDKEIINQEISKLEENYKQTFKGY